MGAGNSDGFAAVTVGSALMLGLLARRRGFEAPNMLTTMISSSMHALSEVMVRYEGHDEAPAADPELYGVGPLYRLYEAADGWVFLAAPSDREWACLCGAIEAECRLVDDPRFATPDGRAANAGELAAELSRAFLQRGAARWEAELGAVGVACAEVAQGPVESHFVDEGSLGRQCGFVTEATQPILGDAPRLAALVKFSRSGTTTRGFCLVGEQTDAILTEIGYSPYRIATLRSAGVIGG